MKHLSAALTAIRRSPYQAFAAILILALTFFVGYTFSLFLFGADQILHYFETRPQVTAFFKLDATNDQIQKVEHDMRSKSYVASTNIITKDQALQIYRQENTDPLALELVTADILPASIEVSGKDITSLATIHADLQKADGVDEVMYQQDVVEGLQKWTQSIRYVGIVSIAILATTSFIIIVVITGMKVAIKKRAIHIMRILGATKWYIKAPFVYEGMIYGLVGSVIGWGAMYISLLYLTPALKSFLDPIPLLPLSNQFLAAQFGSGTGIGILLGAFASSFAVQRMMRRA